MSDHPNADAIAALREIADVLEAHPELPPAGGHVSLRSRYSSLNYDGDATPREVLTATAAALGDRAEERADADAVNVGVYIGPFRLFAEATIYELNGLPKPPKIPEYEPIILSRS